MSLTLDQWAFIFGLMGNVISFGVFLSPMPTFYKIYNKKSTQEYQSLPYVVALSSSLLWVYYAFLKPNTTLLITINTFGIFIETIYISFYLFYATKQSRILTLKMLLGLVCGFVPLVLLTYFLADGILRIDIVGWVCLVFALCVFVAPLGIVRKVYQTKSVEYMPLSLSVFLTLSAIVWFFYGLLMKDINVAVPNVLGFILGVLQIVLYKIYYKADKQLKKESSEKVPEKLEDQIVIVGQQNPPHGGGRQEEIIDIPHRLENSEKIPVVLCRIDEATTCPKEQYHAIQMGQQQQQPILVTAA